MALHFAQTMDHWNNYVRIPLREYLVNGPSNDSQEWKPRLDDTIAPNTA